MNKKTYIRFLSLFLCAAALLGYLAPLAEAAEEQPLAVIWAGSDIQGEGMDGGIMTAIVDTMVNDGYTHVDEAFFLGDYAEGFDSAQTSAGTQRVRNILNNAWGLDYEDILMVQGNHDPADTANLDANGAYEREHYSVYLIHEDSYIAGQYKAAPIKATANALKAYLDEKAAQNYTKPIFIATHVPLHNSGRGDNRYASYLVSVLNEAGKKGLNIIYLFGHNHSGGYDRYIGGSCIYYAPGSEILVFDPEGFDEFDYTVEKIHFTYFLPGYLGYTYSGEPDATTSASILEVYADRVELRRYNEEGLCNLKNMGTNSTTWDRNWAADPSVTPSPGTVQLIDLFVAWEDPSFASAKELPAGETMEARLTISGSEGFYVTWESSSPEVAAVQAGDEPGTAIITGLKDGSTTITATVQDTTGTGETASISFSLIVGFDPELKNGMIFENGGYFYYRNGKKQYNAGLILLDGYYYYIRSNAQAAVGEYWVSNHNGLLPEGMYTFGPDGRMER